MTPPSISFLRKVADGGVYLSFGYSQRRGVYHRFVGEKTTYDKHQMLGYVAPIGFAELGRPAYGKLTDLGARLLAEAEAL